MGRSRQYRTFYGRLISEDHHKLCLKLSESFAALSPLPIDKLTFLMTMCPNVDPESDCVLDMRSLSGVIALGLCHAKTNFQHSDVVVDYLLKLISRLKTARWNCPPLFFTRRGIPFPEVFGFILGTILTDLAYFVNEHRYTIVGEVLKVLGDFYESWMIQNTAPDDINVIFRVPCIIGLLRSFGRASSNQQPIIRLFFDPKILENSSKCEEKAIKCVDNAESSLLKSYAIDHQARIALSVRTNVMRRPSKFFAITPPEGKLCPEELINFDVTTLFNEFGSSYPVLKHVSGIDTSQILELSTEQLLNAKLIISYLLNEDLLRKLDEACSQLSDKMSASFPYTSFSETVILAAMSLTNALIYHYDELDEKVRLDLQDLVKSKFAITQKSEDVDKKYQASGNCKISSDGFTPYYLYFKANAETFELLVRVVEEEGAEKLSTSLSRKIDPRLEQSFSRTLQYRTLEYQMPVFICSLNCLGTLAEKFPGSQAAKDSHDRLLQFLLKPSPVLMAANKKALQIQSSTAAQTSTLNEFAIQERSSWMLTQLRDIAIENLSRSMRAIQSFSPKDSTIVNSTLAELSNTVYSAANSSSGRSESEMVCQNCVLVLGHLAISQNQVPEMMVKVFGIYQQLFCNPPSPLDEMIVEQMGYMVMVGANTSVYQDILKLFSSALCVVQGAQSPDTAAPSSRLGTLGKQNTGGNSSSSDLGRYSLMHSNSSNLTAAAAAAKSAQHVTTAINSALLSIAASIEDAANMEDLLSRLLILFSNLGMNAVRAKANPAAVDIACSPLFGTVPSMRFSELTDSMASTSEGSSSTTPATSTTGNLGYLLPVIATLVKRMPLEFEPKRKIYKSFQHFWSLCSYLGFTKPHNQSGVWPVEWFTAICEIARKSPILLSFEESQTLKQVLDADFSLFKPYVAANEIPAMKLALVTDIGASGEVYAAIQRMDSASQLNFAWAILSLERLRHTHLATPSFRGIFRYFEELQLMKEGKANAMWIVIKAICDYVFTLYLRAMQDEKRDRKHEKLLEQHGQFLLVKFNDPSLVIRKQADHFLTQLIDKFPSLLWNYEFLRTLLEILEIQSECQNQQTEGVFKTVPVPNTPYELVITTTLEERTAIMNDFRTRTKYFISEAIRGAAKTTQSHLKQYIDEKGESCVGVYPLPGLQIAEEFVNLKATAVSGSNLGVFLNLRGRYLGEARGMKIYCEQSASNEEEIQQKTRETHQTIIQSIHRAGTDDEFLKGIFRATALLMLCEDDSQTRDLLSHICLGVLDQFTEMGMQASIACWDWVLSARPDMTLQLFMFLTMTWTNSINRKLGVFSEEVAPPNPSTASTSADMAFKLPPVLPHSLFTQFLEHKFLSCKGSNNEVVEMLFQLVNSTLLADSVCRQVSGDHIPTPIMNRSLACVGVRFKFLSLGLQLCQCQSLFSPLARSVLRDRIYYCAFEHFTLAALPPTQKRQQLREDITVLIDFAQLLRNDKFFMEPGGPGNVAKKKKQAADGMLTRKRNLLICLLWTEIERFIIWYSPLGVTDPSERFEGAEKLMQSVLLPQNEKQWKEYVRIAWHLCPDLAVFLPMRFRHHIAIVSEVTRLVRTNPQLVSHVAAAIEFIANDDALRNDSSELNHVLSWKFGTPSIAMKLLSGQLSSNAFTAQYAIRVLQAYPQDVLVFYVPQLVQALRYDVLGYVRQFILWATARYSMLAHQLIWNMKTNAYCDEDSKVKDEKIGDLLLQLIDQIISGFSPSQKSLYKREFEFFNDVTSISGHIKNYEKGPKRREACQKLLKKIVLRRGCYLPTDPGAEVVGIDYTSGIPMQSAAKAPYLATFHVRKCGFSELENIDENVQQDPPNLDDSYTQGCIFKVGDDCRQDMLCLQLIQLFQNIFKTIGLDVYLCPYKVVATSPGCGVIECVPDAKTRDEIGKKTEESLNVYWVNTYGDESTHEYQEARRNFVISMAAYSVVGYMLQIKDRHNGNIMIDKFGHVIHIDFGFLFESSPGGNMNWEPDFKLTDDFLQLMVAGAKTPAGQEPPFFRLFRELTVKAFLAIRPYHEDIITLVSLMLDTSLPCFKGQTIKQLKERLRLNSTEKEAADHMIQVINYNCRNMRSQTYDYIQALQNNIVYF